MTFEERRDSLIAEANHKTRVRYSESYIQSLEDERRKVELEHQRGDDVYANESGGGL